MNTEMHEIILKQAKRKAKIEFSKNTHIHFDIQECESFLIMRGLKEIINFNKGTKGDNFLRYINQCYKLDFLDFIRKQHKQYSRVAFSLDDVITNEDGKEVNYKLVEKLITYDQYNFIEEDSDLNKILLGRLLQVYELHQQGYKGKEIASMLSINKNTVTADLKKIRECLIAYESKGDAEIMERKIKSLPIDKNYINLYKPNYDCYCNVGNNSIFKSKDIKNPIPWEDGKNDASIVKHGKFVDGKIVWNDGTTEELSVHGKTFFNCN